MCLIGHYNEGWELIPWWITALDGILITAAHPIELSYQIGAENSKQPDGSPDHCQSPAIERTGNGCYILLEDPFPIQAMKPPADTPQTAGMSRLTG